MINLCINLDNVIASRVSGLGFVPVGPILADT